MISIFGKAARRGRRQRYVGVHGMKRLHYGDVLTPYGAKLMRKRRAARKAAHESRRRNRA